MPNSKLTEKTHIFILTRVLSLFFSFFFIALIVIAFTVPAQAVTEAECASATCIDDGFEGFHCSVEGCDPIIEPLTCAHGSCVCLGCVVSTTNTGVGHTVNVTGSCIDAIDTALGCIPYKIDDFTSSLLGFVAGIIGAIALVVMLIGTITIMTASGNPEAIKKGKELFGGAITGLLFIIFSVVILKLIAGDIIKLPGF